MSTKFLIGTSGYSFADWKGTVYPQKIPQAQMLPHYEKELGFNAVEINYTYYRPPSAPIMESMARKTSNKFLFTVRSHKEMTHEIWTDKNRTKIKDNTGIFKAFREGIRPLLEVEKLQCVLIQFPTFFWPKKENQDYILSCKDRLPDIPLVIEFRNNSWVGQERLEKTLALLEKNDLGFCVVDEPRLPRLLPFIPKLTSDIAYFRFHGRNPEWYKASRAERYNYNYTDQELNDLIPDIKSLAMNARVICLFFNNCHAGAAAKNALRLKDLLGISD